MEAIAIAWDLLKQHTTGWETYVEAVKQRYAPEQVKDITMIDPAYLREVAAKWAEAFLGNLDDRQLLAGQAHGSTVDVDLGFVDPMQLGGQASHLAVDVLACAVDRHAHQHS